MADTKLENMSATTTPALTDLAYLVRPGGPSVDYKVTLANLHKVLGGVTDITYANLVSAIGGATLTPGTLYRITDYATKHYIVDADFTQYLTGDGIVTGASEPLIVLATGTDTIDKTAYSETYPQDVIYYDWDPANWLDDLSFADLSGAPVIITGFKGVITFRHDTLLDNYAPGDWRNCLSRRWKFDADDWDNSTPYTTGNLVKHGTAIYMALKNGTNKEPDVEAAYWTIQFDLSVNEYWSCSSSSWYGINADPTAYDDFTLYAEGSGSATYELCCRSNHWERFADCNTNLDNTGSILPNNVVFLLDNDYYTFWSNTIGPESAFNTIFSTCEYNHMGAYFTKNTIGTLNTVDFYYNYIKEACQLNIFAGTIINNSIGSDFNNNIIMSDMKFNVFSNKISGLCIGGNTSTFRDNHIENNITLPDYLFLATHVYADYTCWIYKRPDGTVKLKYLDNSDVLTVVAVTA